MSDDIASMSFEAAMKEFEEIVTRLVKSLMAETGQKNVCLAGGVALNCVANGKLVREGIVENLWVQPAAGDAGAPALQLGLEDLIS